MIAVAVFSWTRITRSQPVVSILVPMFFCVSGCFTV